MASVLVAAVLASVLAGSPSAARAATAVTDQSSSFSASAVRYCNTEIRPGQTFRAGITGWLDQVDLQRQGDATVILVYRADDDGVPDWSTVIGSGTVPATSSLDVVTATLVDRPLLVAGSRYAFELGDGACAAGIGVLLPGSYGDGYSYSRTTAGYYNDNSRESDLKFTTRVEPDPDYVAPVIATASLPDGTVDAPYAQQLVATGDPAPTWSIASGQLPAGLTLSASGLLSGTPTAAGSSTLTVAADNAGIATRELSITIGLAAFSSVADVTIAGTVGYGQTVSVGIPTAIPAATSYSVEWRDGASVIAGASGHDFPILDPDLIGHDLRVAVTASRDGYRSETVVSPAVTVAPLAPTITTTELPRARVGVPYSTTLTATGVPAPGWSVVDGPLPAGLSLSSDGRLTGTPERSGDTDVTVRAANGLTADAVLGIRVDLGQLTSAAAPVISGTAEYGATLTAVAGPVVPDAGSVDFAWSVAQGPVIGTAPTLPLTDPHLVGAEIVVSATVHRDQYEDRTVVSEPVTVRPSAPGITTTALPDAVVDAPYSVALAATGTPAPRWTIASGSLPAGLTLSDSGTVSGSPRVAGDFAVTVTADNGRLETVTYSVHVGRASFSAAPTVAISGDALVGSVLTAHPGAAVPAPDTTALQWYADGIAIPGATGATLVVPVELVGRSIGVSVIAGRAGYADATARSAAVGPVARPAAAVRVSAPAWTLAGTKARVRATGLAARESYTVRVGGRVVARGAADALGRVDTRVTVPPATAAGRRTVTVVGAQADRRGASTTRIYRASAPRVAVAHRWLRASRDEVITVTRLLPGERVTAVYNGRRISSRGAHADASGRYRLSFDVGTRWGVRTLTVSAGTTRRSTSTHVVVSPFRALG
ncbi:hypothetical protein QT381_12515 [Galbitalea sp. SE-J8]|uniref:Ig domain-containing protein n=1 Tax=Galbitalea sp. SE-J8 TaxID=3054952 RepID=UPI00259C6B8C|nr:putative Ig domain-containing protein [Galbitalea sp. SE-J8]MDM4763831.1 hypothetical protein [Galbitalea sp. SE-J8]